MQDPLFQTLAFLAITIYIALGIHVIGQQPGRRINRVFAYFCFSVALFYLTTLLLYPRPKVTYEEIPLALRIKVVGLLLAPAFYYHLMSFYFPESWRGRLAWMPWIYYGIASLFSLITLFTTWVVAGPLVLGLNTYMGSVPGPLLPLARLYMLLAIATGALGIALATFRAKVPAVRRQLYNVLIPTLISVAGAIVYWLILPVNQSSGDIHLLADFLILIGGILYTRAVLQYGYFVGRPLSSVRVLYGMVATFGTLAILFPAVIFDIVQIEAGIYPFPLITGILIIAIGSSMTSFFKRTMPALQRFLFSSERSQQMPFQAEITETFESINLQELQADLLAILCGTLKVKGGYLAFAQAKDGEALEIRVVQGSLSISPGAVVSRPTMVHQEPKLASALHLDEVEAAGWSEIAVFCSLILQDGRTGLLALGEKNSRHPFTQAELSVCSTLARQIEDAANLVQLKEQRNNQIEVVQAQTAAISQLEESVIASTMEALTHLDAPLPSLEIRILGPMQVSLNGVQAPEADWGSERAKALLAFLLWKGPSGATRDEITWLLWPDHDGERAANVFHVTVNRLRKVLEPHRQKPRDSQYILHERGRYRFNFSAPHWMDWTAFQRLSASNELTELAQAASLYRGPLLDDESGALPADIEVDRRILEQRYVSVLKRLANGSEGEEEEIFLRKLVAINPTDEDAHRALVDYYQNHSRPDLAGQHVKRWKADFAKLGLTPARENAELWQKIGSHRTR